MLEGARNKVYRTANIEMLLAYWNVGREIVEEEQMGKSRAGYGSFLIENLSLKLTEAFGKDFTQSNLRYMRLFYQAFEKHHALRDELSWTHYHLLVKVERKNAREWINNIPRPLFFDETGSPAIAFPIHPDNEQTFLQSGYIHLLVSRFQPLFPDQPSGHIIDPYN